MVRVPPQESKILPIFGSTSIRKNILLISPISAILLVRNLNSTATMACCRGGPGNRESFSENPEGAFAEASNTMRHFVIVTINVGSN